MLTAHLPGAELEESKKLLLVRIPNFDFVGYATKEGLIYQVMRFKIRRKDDQKFEWNLDFLSGR